MNKKFKEAEGLNHVARFHYMFGMPVLPSPDIPDKKRCELRINLLQEELNELKEALEDKDIVEVADALCDLQYVLSGAILEFGLGDIFSKLFDEVQRSNMSKTCKTEKEATATQAHYLESKGVESFIVERDDQFLVFRSNDKKVLKSVKYSPADLKEILKGRQ
jgi:predicted HAD superfamily Cof-like phosphohydrolase